MASTEAEEIATEHTDITTIINARLILPTHEMPVPGSISFSRKTGLITSIDIDNGSASQWSQTKSTAPTATKGSSRTIVDLNSQILAPGFLDLQTNGLAGVHFTTLASSSSRSKTKSNSDNSNGNDSNGNDSNGNDSNGNDDIVRLTKCARLLTKSGTTAFWATIPTVAQHRWQEILPVLAPRGFRPPFPSSSNTTASPSSLSSSSSSQPIGATLLGAHLEGPYLSPSKRGAHSAAYMLLPSSHPYESLYGGPVHLNSTIKLITLAPELPGSLTMIRSLRERYPHIRVSLGHSAASYDQAVEGVRAGASMVTHVFNAMNGWSGRDAGLAGLMLSGSGGGGGGGTGGIGGGSGNGSDKKEEATKEVYYSIIADGVHLSPQTMHLALSLGLHHHQHPNNNEPSSGSGRGDGGGVGGGRCIAITDAIELAGLPDGTYPGNDQITCRQVKSGGNRVVREDDGKTLIGSCVLLDQVVRVLVGVLMREGGWEKDRAAVAAVKCVSENVAGMMGLDGCDNGGGGGGGGDIRGILKRGARADFAVLDWEGIDPATAAAAAAAADAGPDGAVAGGAGELGREEGREKEQEIVVKQTWIAGHKVFDAREVC